ncbi:rod shape-determining protein RodA [Streptomyces sp. 3MP-14]|uniref:peptidoglycan glycosyltransferase n=1 Tax=Streptomyces mimosae TaxID=2586635 RepID=A0A5N6AP77_9ACTN|nr:MULTISPECIES: FtsW/RodA/SpoVE family cell cycle protein [Streptomyces]KAB8169700.1 rod shape-determining protein RodA [Streptomyces mimosae]KAB8178448.1 rod shape-determining protein RodA [Streptomyces sp. 3MP-14]
MNNHHLRVDGLGPDPGTWRRLTARDSVLRRVDWVLLLAALALSVIGILLVWSATRNRTEINSGDPHYFLVRQGINLALGLGLAVGVMWLGHHRLRSAVPLFFGFSMLFMLLVFTPLGTEINGQRAWLSIGGYTLQPGEFAKVAIILGMAVILADQVDAGDRDYPSRRAVLQALALATAPLCIVVIDDMGMAMVLSVIVLGILLASGASLKWSIGLMLAGIVGAALVWTLGVLDDYQLDRFAAFADPSRDPAGVGYNTNQARIAIGSGQLDGKGLFQGTQTTGQFVPEQHTDFIFTVAGEELGFLGAGGIIVLIGVVLWRALRIARDSSELYGTIIAAGIVAWFAFQCFENIGMALGIMPVAGVPLPFLSYGGTAMFAVWIAIGLLQSVRMKRPLTA